MNSRETKTFKSGDWVKGIAFGAVYDRYVTGIFVGSLTRDWNLIATWVTKSRKMKLYTEGFAPTKITKIRKKKKYVRVVADSTELVSRPDDVPKGFELFAQKHSLY